MVKSFASVKSLNNIASTGSFRMTCMSKCCCFKTNLAALIALDSATLPSLMLQKDSNALQCTVKPHIPLTHTVPSPDLETLPEPDSLVCLHTSSGSGGPINKEVQLHSKPCGRQCLPSARRGAAVLTPAAFTLSGWRTQPVSSYLAASTALIWMLRLLWRAESLDGAAGNCQHCGRWGKGDESWMLVTVEPLHDLIKKKRERNPVFEFVLEVKTVCWRRQRLNVQG